MCLRSSKETLSSCWLSLCNLLTEEAYSMQRRPSCNKMLTKRHERDQTSLCTAPGVITTHFKTVKQSRDSSASVLPEAWKWCRPVSESEQAQSPMLMPVKGDCLTPDLLFLVVCTAFAERFYSAGLQYCSHGLPEDPQASQRDGLTPEIDTGISEKETRGLKLALLVELQQLVRFRLQRAQEMCSLTHP